MTVAEINVSFSEPASQAQVQNVPQLIMDFRCEEAIRKHLETLGHVPEPDFWKIVNKQVQAIYECLLRNVPGLLDYPDGNVLHAPINNGVLYPLKGVRGVGVMFLMDERPNKNAVADLSVAATFWFAGSAVCIGARNHKA